MGELTALPAPGELLAHYLHGGSDIDTATAAFYACLDTVAAAQPDVARAIACEFHDQRTNVKLIASENYSSLRVQAAQANLLTDKYAEGFPAHRFYAGCENVDAIEAHAVGLARRLFGATHAYVQPHSGADANLVAYLAILATRVEAPALKRIGATNPAALSVADWESIRAQTTGQRLLGMDLYSGGHLTHGYRHNVSARLFEAHSYTVDPRTRLLDMAQVRERALQVRPAILLAGYSAYPRRIDFAAFRQIADEVDAVLMVDMAHFAGLVAGKVFTGDFDPVPHAHVVTSTTHKTLRGPRGGLVLADGEFADAVDKGCPLVLGGPLAHAIAAKAVAFGEALEPDFRGYAAAIVENARTLADALLRLGTTVVSGGTDNHIVLLDVASSYGLSGRQAETVLRECGITVNRNALPFDINGPWYTSGLRLGTPAITTLGMGAEEMVEIAGIIDAVLRSTTPRTTAAGAPSRAGYDVPALVAAAARDRAASLLARHPLYPTIDMDVIASAAGRVPS